jgi:hypothetical protein
MCVMRNSFYKVPLPSPTDEISSEIYARNSCTIYYCFLYGGAENSNLCSFNQRFYESSFVETLKEALERAIRLTSNQFSLICGKSPGKLSRQAEKKFAAVDDVG